MKSIDVIKSENLLQKYLLSDLFPLHCLIESTTHGGFVIISSDCFDSVPTLAAYTGCELSKLGGVWSPYVAQLYCANLLGVILARCGPML